jgi:uncharacterized phiE125 gp8 family phage protein
MLPADIRTTLTVVTPPAGDLIAVADIKSQARIDSDDDDTLLQLLADSAMAHLDGADGILARALLQQTWLMRLDTFGNLYAADIIGRVYNQILVPLPPLIAIDSIKYIDVNGVQQIVDPSIYQLVPAGTRHAVIVPSYGNQWPSPRGQMDAVQVQFTAGYGEDAADVPAPIRHAAMLLAAHWYEHREAVIADNRVAVAEMPFAVERLLAPYRASWF